MTTLPPIPPPGSRLDAPRRLDEQDWPERVSPLVSIICTTYNHENFIGDCLQSFLMQETTFPVEIIVQDDASADSTTAIVHEYSHRYPRLSRPIFHAENQYSRGKKPSLLAYRHAHGEYIATCEGDDFWSLPSKLEQQIQILESHRECFLCGGRVLVIRDGHRTPYKIDPPNDPEELKTLGPVEMLRGQWTMRTLSRVARRSVWDEYTRIVGDTPASCDFLFSLYCIARSRMNPIAFHCLDEVVGTYREHSGGIWFGASEAQKKTTNLEVILFALQHFDFGEQTILMESGFIDLTEELNLTEAMHPAAYASYLELKAAHAPPRLLRRIRNYLSRLFIRERSGGH